MKITKLVILFNRDKILIGILTSVVSYIISNYVLNPLSLVFLILSGLIILNIIAALIASYILYDKSDLYKPKRLFDDLQFKDDDKVMFLHASFDPVSIELEEMFGDNLSIYNIYGNRHEDESAIKISERYFPPNKKETKIDPTAFSDDDNTYDYILAITSIHEILKHNDRVKFFNEAKRVLKDDGTMVVCEQMRDCINFLFFNFGALHFISMKKWKAAIKEAKMNISSCKKLTSFAKVLYVKN